MRVKIELVERKGPLPCRHGHQVGNSFDFDEDRGRLCPLAMHVMFPMVDILRYGGKLPSDRFCCPDADTINVFKIETIND